MPNSNASTCQGSCALARVGAIVVQIPEIVDEVRGRGGHAKGHKREYGCPQTRSIRERKRSEHGYEDQQILKPLVRPNGAQPQREPGSGGLELTLEQRAPGDL